MSAAAARRNITQPAFSRRIRALEDWLGTPLVERHPNRVTLTPALTAREAEIRALLATLTRFRQSGGVQRRTFIVATQHSLAISAFPDIYSRLTAVEGVDTVRLRTRNQSEVIALFLRHEADLILSYQAHGGPRLPFDNSVAQSVWRRDALLPVVGGALRFALSEDQLPGPDIPTLRYPDDTEFGRILRASPSTEPFFARETVGVESAFAASMVTLVRRGAGIGWVPHSLIRDELRRAEILPLAAAYGRIPIDVVLSAHRNNTLGCRALSALVPGR